MVSHLRHLRDPIVRHQIQIDFSGSILFGDSRLVAPNAYRWSRYTMITSSSLILALICSHRCRMHDKFITTLNNSSTAFFGSGPAVD